jgi:uncharacterized protein YegL
MVDIVFLLDESTSMINHTNSYIKCINKLINSQKQINPYSNFSLIKFSSTINTFCIDTKINTLQEFKSYNYNPSGSTSLYDAIGYIINIKHINKIKPVIVIILTDGIDNSSIQYNIDSIKQYISYVIIRGWTFVYIATNQNAKIIGQQLGIETCLTYNETEQSIDKVADACSIAIGHTMYKWTSNYNKYCDEEMPTDVSILTEKISNFRI